MNESHRSESFSSESKSVCTSNVLFVCFGSVCVLSDKSAFVIHCSLLIKHQTLTADSFSALIYLIKIDTKVLISALEQKYTTLKPCSFEIK